MHIRNQRYTGNGRPAARAIAVPLDAMLFDLPPAERRGIEIMADFWRTSQRLFAGLARSGALLLPRPSSARSSSGER